MGMGGRVRIGRMGREGPVHFSLHWSRFHSEVSIKEMFIIQLLQTRNLFSMDSRCLKDCSLKL